MVIFETFSLLLSSETLPLLNKDLQHFKTLLYEFTVEIQFTKEKDTTVQT